MYRMESPLYVRYSFKIHVTYHNICGRFGDTWSWVAPGPERQPVAAADALEADEDAPNAVEGAQADPAQEPLPLPPAPQPWTMSQRIDCMTQLMDASCHTYQAFDSTHVGSSRMPYQRRVRPRTGDASTSAAPYADDQPDP
ncbi:hypothetical protein Tco_0386450 [Tanacetum coccineum]